MPMYLTLTIISIFLLILVYPIRVNLYTEDGIKSKIQIFGFINITLDLKKIVKQFYKRKDLPEAENPPDDFNIMEIIENYKKIISMQPFYHDMLRRTTVDRFYWYTSVPMDDEIAGLAILPIYTTAQTVVVDYLYTHFRKVRDYDLDTKYNFLTDDIFMYLDSIISINLLRIIIVGSKYINKLPLILKRTT